MPHNMISLFARSKGLQKALKLFFLRPDEKFYLREIERLLKEPVASLQRHLHFLEKQTLIQSEKIGPLKYFFLNKSHPHFQELNTILLKEVRKEKLEKNLQKALHILKKNYKPEKVILFGSLGGGRVMPQSDIDLFIVKKNVPRRYWDRVKELAPMFKDCDVGIDFVVWTPKELEDKKNHGSFLEEEILRKGRVVYERAA